MAIFVAYVGLYVLFGILFLLILARTVGHLAALVPAPKFVSAVGGAFRVLLGVYIAVALAAYAWERPWIEANHYANREILKSSKSRGSSTSYSESWVSDQLLERLDPSGTLVVVSFSGGGSRAAYFAAAVLDQLRSVRMPGREGPGSSLVNNIDLLSTVSGGSVAGAYFTAYLPSLDVSSSGSLSKFFDDFKSTMSLDFEHDIASEILDPRDSVAFAMHQRTVAEALADSFDRRLFSGRGLVFRELFQHASTNRGPLLVINATALSHMDLFTFTKNEQGGQLFVRTQRPSSLDTPALWWLSRRGDDATGPSLIAFGPTFGDLDDFSVASAIAASAAFPGFGTIPLGAASDPNEPTAYLADGGLIDNSGLVSLYTSVFQRTFFEKAEHKLKKIIIIIIDASAEDSEHHGLIGETSGMYDVQQQTIQEFVLPDMLRRAVSQDLADILDTPGWKGLEIPPPIVFSYRTCLGKLPPVPTAFRLSATQRSVLDQTARNCVNSEKRALLEARLSKPYVPVPLYQGILSETDRHVWGSLYVIAQDERKYWKSRGSWAVGKQFHQSVKVGDETLLLAKGLAPDEYGFVFDAAREGRDLVIFATPTHYQLTGWVSLALDLTPEIAVENDTDFCLELHSRLHGGDLAGRRASKTDPKIEPYTEDPNDECLF